MLEIGIALIILAILAGTCEAFDRWDRARKRVGKFRRFVSYEDFDKATYYTYKGR